MTRKDLRGFHPDAVSEIIDDVPARSTLRSSASGAPRPAALDLPEDWLTIAERMAALPAVLTIVNRRQDARDLHALLKDRAPEGLYHPRP